MERSLFDLGEPRPEGYRDVTPDDVHRHAAGARLVDVREPAEFTGELGHVAGSELVPLATLAAAAAGWDRARDVVLICRSGNRSGTAARALVELGFRRVMNMRGGMLAFGAAGLPVAR